MWDIILTWFSDRRERRALLREFNYTAKVAFVEGIAPTLIEAKTTIGVADYRHTFSKFMAGGFRIKALSGRVLSKSELSEIGKIILADEARVRKLISLGWDTLEVYDEKGYIGCKWALKDFAKIGGFIK